MKAYFIGNIRYFANRIAVIIVLLIIILLAYFFYYPQVSFWGSTFVNPFYSYFEYLSWWLHFMAFVTIISTIVVIIFLFASFYFNIKKQRQDTKETEYELRFTKKIVSYLYSDFLLDGIQKEDYYKYFSRLANNRKSSEILFRIIDRIQKLLDEDFRQKFNELLENTDLIKRIKYSLYSNNVSEKIIALKVISYLGVKGYNKKIARYINSKNYALRNEAIVAYVRLSDTNNLDFLLEQRHHISQLELNSILNAIAHNLKEDTIDYEKLIASSSPRVNMAGIMLIKERNKGEYMHLVKDAMKDEDSLLREVAWDVYASLGKSDSDLDFMISRFDDEFHENRINIMKSLLNFEMTDKLLDFLDKVIRNESILLKIYALRILFEKNMNKLFTYQNMGDERIAIAFKEVADFNIT